MISVILPIYNAAQFLEEAIDSILGQTEKDFELLALDDGSTDESPTILARAAAKDNRVRVLRAPHRGLVATLNRGLAAAKGSLIARMDADDICLPNRFEKQREFLDQHPEMDLVATQVSYSGDPVKQRGFANFVNWNNRLVAERDIRLQRFVETPLVHPSVMFRTHLVYEYGGYRGGPFPEDYELWLRWLEHGVRMAKLDEVHLHWREHPNRLSRIDPRIHHSAFYKIKAHYLARWIVRNHASKPILIWGAGRLSRRRAELLEPKGIEIQAYIDIDPQKIGKRHRGIPVLSLEALPEPGEALVLSYVANRGAREAIAKELDERGYRHGSDYVLAA